MSASTAASNSIMEEPQSLQSSYVEAESKRKRFEASWDSTSPAFQENLAAALTAFENCLKLVERLSLFSPNETLEDVSSVNLQYLVLHYQHAQLLLRSVTGERKDVLQAVKFEFGTYLRLLETYEILSREDTKTYERYQEDPATFSTASVTDAASRRQTKIARFKHEKQLKAKLEALNTSPKIFQNDEAALRELHLANISLCTHQTFEYLESIAQELHILRLAPPPQPRELSITDKRSKNAHNSAYSDRLDPPIVQLTDKSGPILSKDGRPLRPFTLLDSRTRLQRGVFRPDHNLPTMSIDEYLEEEKRRGGIIEGGGPLSGLRPEPDEDNHDKADQETMKARAWDDFKEANPKGAGNTMNMG